MKRVSTFMCLDPNGGLFTYMYEKGIYEKGIYVSWSTSELRVRLAPLNWFKPSSKIFY